MKQGGFYEQVYALVKRIPRGRVATYGQIALLLGHPRAAKIVGRAMALAPPGLPCHRVVNRKGALSPPDVFGGAGIQRAALENEGITFLSSGRIDLKIYIWHEE